MKRWIISFFLSLAIVILCFIPKVDFKIDDSKNVRTEKIFVELKNKKIVSNDNEKKSTVVKEKNTPPKTLVEKNKKAPDDKIIEKNLVDENLHNENLIDKDERNFFDETINEVLPDENQSIGFSEDDGNENQEPQKIDKSKIDEYRKYVLEKIAGKKNYPLSCRSNGETGNVKIKLVLDKNGGLILNEVFSACEFEKLNNAALTAVKKSAPFKPLPEDLETFEIVFTMEFSLE